MSISSSLLAILTCSKISIVLLVLLITHANVQQVESLSFNFPNFNPNMGGDIIYSNDSSPAKGVIQLTSDTAVGSLRSSVGRASYSHPVRLWNKSTNKTTNFTTHFSFDIVPVGPNAGDGLAFFLMPYDNSTAYAPHDSIGGTLGLEGGHTRFGNLTTKYPFVAVEFDTYRNSLDPNGDHVGIDVNSVVSNTTFIVSGGLKNRTTANVWITYDSSTKNLSVFLTYAANPVFSGQSNLSYVIDLTSVLPESVRVGFSAATGTDYEIHDILSWGFNSTLEDDSTDTGVLTPWQNHTSTAPTEGKSKGALVGGLAAAISVLTIGFSSLVIMWYRRRYGARSDDTSFQMDDDEFDEETGPRRFTYNELKRATNNFLEEGKLGEGGFGGVYRGFLADLSKEIAVKKISRGSKQGKKEYVSEVKIISRLRHRNLVQLLGWCHERGRLLLVHEFMPNGSLDSHLYKEKKGIILPWSERYKIAQGLASALLYLHEEWEQCVLHRDIKSSNVMLDSNFNAKLGDFGLARLVDHNLGSQTTALAGTLGYLAPECVMTGKSSKESDVYSFGVVALEIACGRRPVEPQEESRKVSIIEWVWQLYGEGRLQDAVDERLEGQFDVQQIECLMVVGLWCCHPEYTLRPSIRQVINVVNLESPLPKLPTKFPVPIYYSPSTNVETFYITPSSSGTTGSRTDATSSSPQSAAFGTAPILHGNLNL